jgi:hypothetical protein
MKLLIDTSHVRFTVTREAAPKLRIDGTQRHDDRTDAPLWVVQVMALDEHGGEILLITLPGKAPDVTVGDTVTPVHLEAVPCHKNTRTRVTFKAKALQPTPRSNLR